MVKLRVNGTGRAQLPRYGGGWMHQFGYVPALQYELLNPRENSWFRATELWHTARQEGVAMNVSHYNQVAKLCGRAGQWSQALAVLNQMNRDGVRADVVTIGAALAACASSTTSPSSSRSDTTSHDGKTTSNNRWKEALTIYSHYKPRLRLDSICYRHVMQCLSKRPDAERSSDLVLAVLADQRRSGIPVVAADLQAALAALPPPPTFSTSTDGDQQLVPSSSSGNNASRVEAPRAALQEQLKDALDNDGDRFSTLSRRHADATTTATSEGGVEQQEHTYEITNNSRGKEPVYLQRAPPLKQRHNVVELRGLPGSW